MRGMQEWKYYVALDILFSCFAGFIDRGMGHIDEVPLMTSPHQI